MTHKENSTVSEETKNALDLIIKRFQPKDKAHDLEALMAVNVVLFTILAKDLPSPKSKPKRRRPNLIAAIKIVEEMKDCGGISDEDIAELHALLVGMR